MMIERERANDIDRGRGDRATVERSTGMTCEKDVPFQGHTLGPYRLASTA